MQKFIKNILLIWPKFELSFWGMQYSLYRVNKRSCTMPLALITIAGMLPRRKYEFRHIDLNHQDITDEDIQWADLVMLSGWIAQFISIISISLRCRYFKKKILLGGPITSGFNQFLKKIDYIFIGEAEGFNLENLINGIANDNAPHLIHASDKPDIKKNQVLPRFDLLDLSHYWEATVQFSRGCPFNCEFCDIIELYGRKQRTKTSAAMIKELECLYELGYRGPVSFVDDNFYGNHKSISNFLSDLIDFQKQRDYPFYFQSQAGINLTHNPKILDLMKQAGFYSIFTGIETPNKDSLRESQKSQNLTVDLIEAITILQSYELYVQAGFIIGFDNDIDNISDTIIQYVNMTDITVAMTGMLYSLPNTQLERRLISEGRIMQSRADSNFDLPNFITKTHPDNLLNEFQKIIRSCFKKAALEKRLNKQKNIFSHAHPMKREIACKELELIAEHLHLYGKKVLQNIEKFRLSTKFEEHVKAHEDYWRS